MLRSFQPPRHLRIPHPYASLSSAHGDRLQTTVTATGLQTAELEAAISALMQRGVNVMLLTMPFVQTHAETDAMLAEYFSYLKDVARRFPGAALVTDYVPIWPDRLFADGIHLNAEGARLFSERLASCITGGRLRPGCDLTWRAETSR